MRLTVRQARRPAAAGTDQGGPVASLRDRPGHRQGAALPRRAGRWAPAAPTRISRAGTYDLTFANVDGRLTLWVDGDLPFGEGVSYPAGPEPGPPTAADLEPVRIAAHQAEIAVDGLVLKRDVYYTLDPSEVDYANLDDDGPIRRLGLLRAAVRPRADSAGCRARAPRLPDRPGPLPDAGG